MKYTCILHTLYVYITIEHQEEAGGGQEAPSLCVCVCGRLLGAIWRATSWEVRSCPKQGAHSVGFEGFNRWQETQTLFDKLPSFPARTTQT